MWPRPAGSKALTSALGWAGGSGLTRGGVAHADGVPHADLVAAHLAQGHCNMRSRLGCHLALRRQHRWGSGEGTTGRASCSALTGACSGHAGGSSGVRASCCATLCMASGHANACTCGQVKARPTSASRAGHLAPHLDGAAHHAGHVAAHRHPLGLGCRRDIVKLAQRLIHAAGRGAGRAHTGTYGRGASAALQMWMVGRSAVTARSRAHGADSQCAATPNKQQKIAASGARPTSRLRRCGCNLQLRFLRLKASDAAVKMATSRAPAASAFSKPCTAAGGGRHWARGGIPVRTLVHNGWHQAGHAGRRQGRRCRTCTVCLHPSQLRLSPCLHVGGEDGVARAWLLPHARQHICRIRQLWHPLGRAAAGWRHTGGPALQE